MSSFPRTQKFTCCSRLLVAKPRHFIKLLRKNVRTVRFSFRRPGRFLIAPAVLIALIFFFFLRVVPPFLIRIGPKFDPTHRDSVFSKDTRYRQYDAVWRVQNDDGKTAAKKTAVEIAYFIQVANDSIALVPRLLQRIHQPQNFYVIHIDGKVPAKFRAEVAEFVSTSKLYQRNIHIMRSDMVTYKAISMVSNTLAGMTIAMQNHKTWDYFINLSGADYPLIAPEDQAMLLARPRVPIGRLNFVSFFPKKEWLPYSFRMRNMHWDPAATGHQSSGSRLVLMRRNKINPLEKHRAFVFAKAEAWMILSRPFVEFVLESAFAKRMLINHLHVLSVAEHYFADILFNHPFWRTTITPDALRRVVWYLKNQRSGQHPYVLDRGSNINTFWEYISDTKSLFARKFSKPNSFLMDKIDTEMSGTGLKKNEARYRTFIKARHDFLKHIVKHFDFLTQETLSNQGYKGPSSAYPSFT